MVWCLEYSIYLYLVWCKEYSISVFGLVYKILYKSVFSCCKYDLWLEFPSYPIIQSIVQSWLFLSYFLLNVPPETRLSNQQNQKWWIFCCCKGWTSYTVGTLHLGLGKVKLMKRRFSKINRRVRYETAKAVNF